LKLASSLVSGRSLTSGMPRFFRAVLVWIGDKPDKFEPTKPASVEDDDLAVDEDDVAIGYYDKAVEREILEQNLSKELEKYLEPVEAVQVRANNVLTEKFEREILRKGFEIVLKATFLFLVKHNVRKFNGGRIL
jgi:hypothetical protein